MSESTGAPPALPEIPPHAPDPANQGQGEPQIPTAPPRPATPHEIEVARLASENKSWRQKYQGAQSELDKLKASSATETEQAIAKARQEGEAAYLERWKSTAMVNAAQARLAEKGVVAIELAARSLDLHDLPFDPETGRVDQAALDARIDELLNRYPLLVPEGQRPPPAVMDGNQQRVTGQSMVNASTADKNALLRYALGR